jgi:hypothetical protein
VQTWLPIRVTESGYDVAQSQWRTQRRKVRKDGNLDYGQAIRRHISAVVGMQGAAMLPACAAADSASGRHSETWGRRAATYSDVERIEDGQE